METFGNNNQLIDIQKVVSENDFNVHGVIHLGAHEAEEYPLYKSIGATNFVWVDAHPDLIDKLRERFKCQIDTRVIKSAISDKSYETFFKIHNDTHTSSLLEMDFIAESHPELFIEREIKVQTISVDDLVRLNQIDMSLYNMLAVDIQGLEYEALLGATETLKHIDFVYIEVETKNLYVGGENYVKICDFMNKNNFELVEEHIRHWFWGDCFFARKK